jgi:hypothetical protein
MKYPITTFLIFLIFLCHTTSAQTSPLLLPVNLVNGQIIDLVSNTPDTKAIRNAGIKSITLFSPERHDTTSTLVERYREIYSKMGDEIPYSSEFRDYHGYNNILYKKGLMAEKQWRSEQTLGCGTGGITMLHQENHTRYFYRKKQLVTEITSVKTEGGRWRDTIAVPVSVKTYNYDRKGFSTSDESYHLPAAGGKDTLREINAYRYNKNGQLTMSFQYEVPFSPARSVMDSLIDLAPDQLGNILLRQSSQWHDTVMLQAFPEKENETDEEYENRQSAINLRDSSDAELTAFYEDDKNDFKELVSYSYTASGALAGKLHFVQSDLSRMDTFWYNEKGQLLRWETWHLEGDNDFQPWERNNLNPLPLHAIWTFTYDGNGRVATCLLNHEASPPLNYSDGHYHFRKEKDVLYTLIYNTDGDMGKVLEKITAYHYGYDPAFMPPVTYEVTDYRLLYEKW